MVRYYNNTSALPDTMVFAVGNAGALQLSYPSGILAAFQAATTISTPVNTTLTLSNTGTGNIILSPGGNVGIGNTTPLATLDVTGSASLSANLSLRGNATAHTFDILDNGSLNFRKSPGGSGQTTSLFIQGDGNVGIGNTTPLAALDVTGSASLSANLSLRGNVTAHTFDILDNGSLNFRKSPGGSSQTTSLFIQGDGNVGIGTTAPGSLLDVRGAAIFNEDSADADFRVESDGNANMLYVDGANNNVNVGTSWDAGIRLGVGMTFPTTIAANQGTGISVYANTVTDAGGARTVATQGVVSIGDVTYANASSAVTVSDIASLWIQNAPVAGTNFTFTRPYALWVDAGNSRFDGNVGIGNTTPLVALDVTGSASLSANLSLRGNATAHTFDILDNGTLNFRKSPGGSGQTTSLFIQGDGNVGIGTTGPNAKLHITGTSGGGYTTTNKLIMQRTEATNPTAMIEFQGSGGGSGTRWQITSDADVTNDFGISYGGTKYLQVLSGGNVGIGTTAPSSFILQTAGSIGPNATASYDLGSPTLAWRNIYSGTSGISGYIQRNAQALSPTNITDDFLIGGTATSSAIIRLAGTNVGGANLLDVFNSGTSVFSVNANQITAGLPTNFTAAGDVSMAYDLQFTNPTASYIKSYAPLYIQSGDPNQNLDLILSAAGTGSAVINDTMIAQNTGNSTTAYQFLDAAGTSIMNIDTNNQRIGIGITAPLRALDVEGGMFVGTGNEFSVNTDGTFTGNMGTSTVNSGTITLGNDVGDV